MASPAVPTPLPQRPLPAAAFEFTKRKHWADLLISELAETIMLVLSPAGKILYCGAAINELLGWRQQDLLDLDFFEFINSDDQPSFRAHFAESMHSQQELLIYARLKCKPELVLHTHRPPNSTDPHASHSELLFELKGHPHYLADDQMCKCFFVMAKTYPSRNTAMLNTFLELKMENERLNERLLDLRTQLHANSQHAMQSSYRSPASLTSSSLSISLPLFAPTPPTLTSPLSTVPVAMRVTSNQLANPLTLAHSNPHHGVSSHSPGREQFPTSPSVVDDCEDTRRKKLKKTNFQEDHVCVDCGRTDSPEWRKGPLGPKTLCNACGLRWAKRARTSATDSANSSATGGPNTPNGSSTGANTSSRSNTDNISGSTSPIGQPPTYQHIQHQHQLPYPHPNSYPRSHQNGYPRHQHHQHQQLQYPQQGIPPGSADVSTFY